MPIAMGVDHLLRDPEPDEGWLEELGTATEFDGIRILSHEFTSPGVSQFLVSTRPDVSPILVVQRVKGRLQYLVKHRKPKPFRRNYAIRSIGAVTRDTIESYVANQLEHHPMADPQVQARLMQYQIENHDINLAEMQKTSHGVYWYNLHLVIVRRALDGGSSSSLATGQINGCGGIRPQSFSAFTGRNTARPSAPGIGLSN